MVSPWRTEWGEGGQKQEDQQGGFHNNPGKNAGGTSQGVCRESGEKGLDSEYVWQWSWEIGFANRLNEEYSRKGGFPVALVVKNSPANAGDMRDVGLIPGLGGSPREGHVNPL